MNEHDATEIAFKNGYKQGRADAVREMQERLKQILHEEGRSNYYLKATIDQIAKEMLENNQKCD